MTGESQTAKPQTTKPEAVEDTPEIPAWAVAAAAGFALIGFALIFVEAGSFGRAARLFPRALSVLGGVASVVVLVQSLLRMAQARRDGVVATLRTKLDSRDVLISYAGPPIYAAALYVFGFWLASAVCLSGLMALLGERRWLLVGALTVGTLLAIYLVFELGFSIRMPRGLVVERLLG